MTLEELKESIEYRELGFKIVKCPICGKDTLDFYWICDECFWEYDNTPEGEYSDCNRAYPEAYRKAYLQKKQEENLQNANAASKKKTEK